MQNVKCVVVGNGDTGKTCLLLNIKHNFHNRQTSEYVLHPFQVTHEFEGKEYTVKLWDTAGQEDYDRLRPIVYPKTDVSLICFSVVSNSSFEDITAKWCPDIRHHCPTTPYLIVGTKTDLRNDEATIKKLKEYKKEHITSKQGEKLANKLKAIKYVECSAVEEKGVQNVLNEAIRAVLESRKPAKKRCVLL